ncbi:pirin-related protein [Escherichia coli]|uniref:Pirin-related protein n=1 Tax=Escherichia coli TaxID=562 RepID=A0A2X1NBA1_ECOLX|nr:pirin-related protein [Escherichia coli]
MEACNYASKCGCTISCRQRRKCEFPVAWATRVFAIDSREISCATHHEEKAALTCGDGAFIRDEANITLVADSPLRALLIDLPV